MKLARVAWDLWCCCSLIGLWPRYIEPRWLSTSRWQQSLVGLDPALDGFKVLQLSDLHLTSETSSRYLSRIARKVAHWKPDLIVFTGDFISYARLEPSDADRLGTFLQELKAPHGCYAVLGNHDYEKYVTKVGRDHYVVAEPPEHPIWCSVSRIFGLRPFIPKEPLPELQIHPELEALLKETDIHLLENRTVQIAGRLNLCGVGEHWVGRCWPHKAFADYNPAYCGLVLAHNPDAVPALESYPGQLILCGHTHGGQVNLPWLWKKLTPLDNPIYKSGCVTLGDKQVYTNRGLGGPLSFRWFSPPEILQLTLRVA